MKEKERVRHVTSLPIVQRRVARVTRVRNLVDNLYIYFRGAGHYPWDLLADPSRGSRKYVLAICDGAKMIRARAFEKVSAICRARERTSTLRRFVWRNRGRRRRSKCNYAICIHNIYNMVIIFLYMRYVSVCGVG